MRSSHKMIAATVLILAASAFAWISLGKDGGGDAASSAMESDKNAFARGDETALSDGGDETLMGSSYDVGEGPLALQVPLEDTIELRKTFLQEYQERIKSSGFDLRELYEEWIDIIGVNGVIDTIITDFPNCHDEGHDLGKVIYKKVGDIGVALRSCQDACNSGCMHGVLMELFSGQIDESSGEHATLNDVRDIVTTVCDEDDMNSLYRRGDCLHGIGHALTFLADYDIVRAIEYCDLFPTHAERYYCATGAYMEYVTVKDPTDAQTESQFYPCDTGAYPAACFRYKMVHVFRRQYTEHKSPIDILNACYALDGKYRLGCIHGTGNAHMGFVADGNLKLFDLCNRGTDDDKYVCIDGVMERLGKFRKNSVELACSTLSGWMLDLCHESAGRAMYDPNKPFDLYQK